MIKVNECTIIQNDDIVEALSSIMTVDEATKLTEDLEKSQVFEQMKEQLREPDTIQLAFEKKMDKERFLEKFKYLHFDRNYPLKQAIEEAKKEVNLTENEITEILEVIVKAAV